MGLFDQFQANPYMNSPRGLPNPRTDLLTNARYQIVPSQRGLPMAQVELTFQRSLSAVSNPDMSLCVLLDRSGSMSEAYAEGHVNNVANAILSHVSWAGIGYDLVFYDDQVSYAGHMRTMNDIDLAIRQNGPRGGTIVTGALRGAIKNYHARKGMYIIVITDGEFGDKVQARQFILNDLLPQVTPDNPFAYRLHFVGAGEGVDHAFLRQIEADAAGQGVSLVSQNHHAHLSHSHASILDELDKTFIGVSLNAQFGDDAALLKTAQTGPESVVTHTVDIPTRRSWDGPVGALGFLPRRAVLGCEFSTLHGKTLDIGLNFQSGNRGQHLQVVVPLPRSAAPTPAAPSKKPGFHLPWIHVTPEQEAANAEAARRRAELAQKVIDVHQAEQKRQQADLLALARGGLPVQATERLHEIASGLGGISFTSNLDPDEAALLRREGYKVRGLVSGSAMYHVGQAYASTQGDCEVTVLSDAYNTATELAVSRLRQELRLIGAHGVVGVRLELVRHEWADKTIEVQVMGTAVEGPGAAPKDPWLCDLSGQEWYALHRAGYEPATMVWGHCTWFILTTQQDEWIHQSWNNQELTHWSGALGRARHIALNHMTAQAKNHNATGIGGVKVERRLDEVRLSGPGEDPTYEREHHNLVVSIIGTAIRLRPDAPAGVKPTVQMLSLRDGRMSAVALGAADVKIE